MVDTRLIAVLEGTVSLRVRFVFSWFSLSETSELVRLFFRGEGEEEVEFIRSALDNTDETVMDGASSVLSLTKGRADLATTSPFVSDADFAATTGSGIAIVCRTTRKMKADARKSKFIDRTYC